MSLQNAIDNLEELGKELNLPEKLELDSNKTCILAIDESFSLHVTYEPNTDRLYLYSPLLDGLPKDKETKLRLYTLLLEGSMLGGQMAGGGVGVAELEELILMHCTIDMKHAASNELRAFVPLFLETVEKWRKKIDAVMTGKDPASLEKKEPMSKGGRMQDSRYMG
jgi:hypothetical protein